MTDCNATLTTATVEPCPNDCANLCIETKTPGHLIGSNSHVTLYTMTCKDHPDTGAGEAFDSTDHRHQHEYGEWYDDTPGATPHVEPVAWVTDAEVEAAVAAWELMQENFDSPHADIRRALEAAAKVRQHTGETP
jgi:hypothetical protein